MEKEIKFEVGKKYRFRDGEGWAKCLMHVPEAIYIERLVFITNKGCIISRCEDGRVSEPKELTANLHEAVDRWLDILPIEYKEPRKFKYWVNVYSSGIGGDYASKEEANKSADSSRIACVCIEGKEGDGLSTTIEEN